MGERIEIDEREASYRLLLLEPQGREAEGNQMWLAELLQIDRGDGWKPASGKVGIYIAEDGIAGFVRD